ncbi:acidic mammalian chitinase-like [Boleophthalmus pectinirostris]|uniref:acidic mammalian chitinase-like n=1 Tax=Boleophthalmus pectinirostris TaxID=150288 RepID=UPI00242A6883|nr:acidic mammalian chitinase-like [Boleophthalmus pectinirostris]
MHGILLTTGLCLFMATMASSNNRLVCYYDRKSSLRPSIGRFTPANFDPKLCTHIIMSHAIINQHKLEPAATSDTALYVEVNNLKTGNSNLKTLLAVGGPGYSSQTFSSMVASANSRQTFINSAKTLLKDYGFDGINVDWRYPGSADSQPQDKNRFISLCQELKTAFASDSLIVSASVSAVKTMIDSSYPDPVSLANSLDFINVLTFELHSPTETVTAHHSPLGALSTNLTDTLTTAYAMNYWRSKGVPADKLNMGFAAFGVAFRLANPNNNGVGAATSTNAPEEGCYGSVPGIWSYYENCIYRQGGTEHWIQEQSVPYAVTQGHWVGYDNTSSIDAKTSHIITNGYGGAVVWSVDLDDYTGQFCGEGTFPFIKYLQSKLPATTTTTTTTAPTTTTTTTTSSNGGGGGGNVCNGKTGHHPNPEDNTTYYNCDHGTGTLQKCPAGLIFCDSCKCCNHPFAC